MHVQTRGLQLLDVATEVRPWQAQIDSKGLTKAHPPTNNELPTTNRSKLPTLQQVS